MSCPNNLKQQRLALHNRKSVNGNIPPVQDAPTENTTTRTVGPRQRPEKRVECGNRPFVQGTLGRLPGIELPRYRYFPAFLSSTFFRGGSHACEEVANDK